MSNALQWAGTIKSQGAVYLPAGEGKISSIHPRDIAMVAALALTRPGHAGKHYEITGPAALTIGEQVQAIARAIGKPLRFVDISPELARVNMRKGGMPEERVEDALAFWAAGFRKQCHARFGQTHIPTCPLKQSHIQLVFEVGDLPTERWLRYYRTLGSPAKVGIGFVPCSPLGAGFLTGTRVAEGDFRIPVNNAGASPSKILLLVDL